MEDLRARYALHDGHVLNDVEVADVLVLVAIEAKALDRLDDYAAFCGLLAPMLPVGLDSELPCLLKDARCASGALAYALQTAQVVRASRGFPARPMKHYKDWGEA